MKVYKFGGASVKDATGIRDLSKIVLGEQANLVVVISALGKTTNALERVLETWLCDDRRYKDQFDDLYTYHLSIAEELFPSGNSALSRIEISFSKLGEYLKRDV